MLFAPVKAGGMGLPVESELLKLGITASGQLVGTTPAADGAFGWMGSWEEAARRHGWAALGKKAREAWERVRDALEFAGSPGVPETVDSADGGLADPDDERRRQLRGARGPLKPYVLSLTVKNLT